MTTTPATQAILPGPFHVSRSSDGTKKWFSARDDASGVTIPAKDRDDAYALVSSLNRACSTYAASQAHSLPGDALRKAWISDAVDTACDGENGKTNGGDWEARWQRSKVRAALTPSALSVPVGDDIAKGLRTSQKALDKIARQEQANIAGYLALRDFPIGSASAQFPPDEVGPNALGSDSPSISAQLREISRISNKYDLRECIEGHDDALGDSYIWRDLMEQCEKLGIDPSALSGDAGEGE